MTVRNAKEFSREDTHRCRSFLFATLGAVVACMFNRQRLRFYENGVVSLHLPPTADVLGSRASRTTHPQALAGFSKLFTALLDAQFSVENPFVFRTKSEVVRSVARNGAADLIGHTVSCARVRDRTRLHPHCGVCSQCIERRFAILAAGQAENDPADMYKVDLLLGPRKVGPQRTLAEAYVRTASTILRMADTAFIANYGEVFRAVRYLGEPENVAGRKIIELHRRHAAGVCRVVDAAIRQHAAALRGRDLPDSCLLVLTVGGRGDQVGLPRVTSDDRAGEVPEAPADVLIAFDPQEEAVLLGSGELKGAHYSLLEAMRPIYQTARDARFLPQDYPPIPASELADALGVTEEAMRRRVVKVRRAIERPGVDPDAVIENLPWRGYRLSPYVRLISPSSFPRSSGHNFPAEGHNSRRVTR